ncbi:MAG: ubiquitin-conjugating enzyme E2, partial [Candidatus Hodarchaeales archaeon]
MLTETEWLDRLTIEAQELTREQPTFRSVNNDLTHWRGEILGSGLYEGGVFVVEIKIPRGYPFEPPNV